MAKKKKQRQPSVGDFAGGALGTGIVGYGLAKRGFEDISGVETYYHGGSKSSIENIKKRGLTGKYSGKTFLGTPEGLGFVTRSKLLAGNYGAYAATAEKIKTKSWFRKPLATLMGTGLTPFGKKVKFKIPRDVASKILIDDPLYRGRKINPILSTIFPGLGQKATKHISKRRIPGYYPEHVEKKLLARAMKRNVGLRGPGVFKLYLGSMLAVAAVSNIYQGVKKAIKNRKEKGKGKVTFRKIRGRIVPIKVKK